MRLKVQSLLRDDFDVSVDPSSSINELLILIQNELKCFDQLLVIYDGKVLDYNKTIFECGICDESSIYVCIKPVVNSQTLIFDKNKKSYLNNSLEEKRQNVVNISNTLTVFMKNGPGGFFFFVYF
jgi:hypothetical protein